MNKSWRVQTTCGRNFVWMAPDLESCKLFVKQRGFVIVHIESLEE